MKFDTLAFGYVFFSPIDDVEGVVASGGGASSRGRTAHNPYTQDGNNNNEPPPRSAPPPRSSSAPPPLQKSNTDVHDDSAARLWKICRRLNGQSIEPNAEELAGHGAEHALMEFVQFATSRPIPVHFDDDLNPTTSSNRCCVASTLVGYAGKYIKHMRRIDPNHTDWKLLKKDEVPKWWTPTRSAMIDKCINNQITWQGDYVWGIKGKKPLYIDLGAEKGDHPLNFCDLKYVITSLVRNAILKRNLNQIYWRAR